MFMRGVPHVQCKRCNFSQCDDSEGVALYNFTGTLTSPKLIAPDQSARAIS